MAPRLIDDGHTQRRATEIQINTLLKAHLRSLGPQVDLGALRPRGRTAAQRGPERQDRRAPRVASLRTGLRQRRTPRPALERPRPRRRHTQHPPFTPAQPKTGGLTHLPTKTRASERRIAIPTECLPSLKEHKERQDRERSQAGAAWGDSSLVFTTPTGRPLDPANLTRRFRTFLDRARLRHIRFHDLRHSKLDRHPPPGTGRRPRRDQGAVGSRPHRRHRRRLRPPPTPPPTPGHRRAEHLPRRPSEQPCDPGRRRRIPA